MISISLAVSFVVLAIILFNPRAAAVIAIILIMITVEVYGFMGLAGINLSAVPAITLILSVGVGMEFTVHMSTVCCLYPVLFRSDCSKLDVYRLRIKPNQ